MILFVIIGIILLRYIYVQVVVSPEVKIQWDRAVKEYEQTQRHSKKQVSVTKESDLDLIYNDIIDL